MRRADVVVDCAPLFEERFAMNERLRGSMAFRWSSVPCTTWNSTCSPSCRGRPPACAVCILSPLPPGAASSRCLAPSPGAVACLGAVEAIKLIAGFGTRWRARCSPPICGRWSFARFSCGGGWIVRFVGRVGKTEARQRSRGISSAERAERRREIKTELMRAGIPRVVVCCMATHVTADSCRPTLTLRLCASAVHSFSLRHSLSSPRHSPSGPVPAE